MRQLLLELGAEKPQSLATFVVGRNQELARRLHLIAEQAPLDEQATYFWGATGAGKTHLLHALADSGRARYIPADASIACFEFAPEISLYLVDDCEQLPANAQIAAFNLYNQIREHGAILVAAGAVAPATLPLREDLRTRLGWGLIYQVHELSDEEKIAALEQAAQAAGFAPAAGVLPYLITHFRRDMRSLSAILDALDRYSLETKRPVTLPLLRSLLQLEQLESDSTT